MSLVFDGTDDYVARASLDGLENSALGTFAMWFKATADLAGTLFRGFNAAGNRFDVVIAVTTGLITATVRNSSNTILWEASTTSTDWADGEFHHLAIAWSLTGTASAQLYVDRVLNQTDATAPTVGTVDLVGATEWLIGADVGGTATFLTGEVSEVLFWPGTKLDLSDADTMRLLVSSDGLTESQSDQGRQNAGPDSGPKPVGYGVQCTLPTGGTRPIIYLSDSFTVNRGTGGNFTVNGAPSEGRGPNIYRSSALRPTFGERWFESEQSGRSYPRSETIIETREGISNFGKRIGLDEVDDRTRGEKPGLTFQQLIIGRGRDREDDSEDRR